MLAARPLFVIVVMALRPVRAGPRDAGPGDPAPGDARPGDAAPGDARPGDPGPGDARPGDPAPGDARPRDTVPVGPGAGAGRPLGRIPAVTARVLLAGDGLTAHADVHRPTRELERAETGGHGPLLDG